MRHWLPALAPWLGALVLSFVAAPAAAQVPQETSFTGKLVNSFGTPLLGPADLELRIFDAESGGTQLYSELHLDIPLDVKGGFALQLGKGTSPSGTFDAALFSDANRWLEVVVGTEVLTPRQGIGSVPWALIAQQANRIVADPTAPRFEECGDGTVADHETGLQWEKKTGALGSDVYCDLTICPDPNDVNNLYRWSILGSEDPDGSAFTDFLARLNGEVEPDPPTGCFAGHCDWKLPKISQLQTILIGPNAAPGQPDTCPGPPCIDPGLAAIDGPISAGLPYWTASTNAEFPIRAWAALVINGLVGSDHKSYAGHVRAVRVGSCH